MEAAPAHKAQEVPDLFRLRQELLFKTYPVSPVREEQSQTVGLPRVLEFWDSMALLEYLLPGSGVSGEVLPSQQPQTV